MLALLHLGRGIDPVFPCRAFARHLDTGLFEQRLVGETANQRKLGHETGDDVGAIGPHPVEMRAEILVPIGRIGDIGRQVQPVIGLFLEVRDPRDIGAFAGGQLDRQLLHDDLIGHVIQRDVDIGVLFHETVQQVLHDLAFHAIGIPHDPHIPGLCRGCESQRGCGGHNANDLFHFLPPLNPRLTATG